MAHLLYRASATPTVPSSTTVKGAGLSNLEIDGNFKSINNNLDSLQSALDNLVSGATLSVDNASSTIHYIGLTTTTSGVWTSAIVSDAKLYFRPSTGTLTSTEFNSLSDKFLKDNITKIESATNTIKQLEGVEFTWKDSGTKSSGVIAQELEKVLPHLVSSVDDIKTVNYTGIIAYLIETIKELDARIKILEGN